MIVVAVLTQARAISKKKSVYVWPPLEHASNYENLCDGIEGPQLSGEGSQE